MQLRGARPEDIPALSRLGSDAFCAAFGSLYSEADLAAFLDQVYSNAALLEELTGEDCRFRLAVDPADGTLLGFCKLRHPSKLAGDSDARDPIELGQLYTAQGRTGEGIGAALMDWALDTARSGGHDAMLLSVYSENLGAQRFYARYGFAKIADITFRVGDQIDAEFLFEKRFEDAPA